MSKEGKNFDLEELGIFQMTNNGLERQITLRSMDDSELHYPIINKIEKELLTDSFGTKSVNIDNYFYFPYFDKSNDLIGYIEIQSTNKSEEEINKIITEISYKLTCIYGLLVQKNIEYLKTMTAQLLLENTTSDVFETAKKYVIKIFGDDIKVFAALQYDSETETFNVKSIGLNSKNSVVAKSGREKKIINVPDVSKVNFYLEGDPFIKSELAIPLIFNNQLIGVMNIESDKLNAFTTNFHLPLFKLICDITTTNYVRISVTKKIGKMNLY